MRFIFTFCGRVSGSGSLERHLDDVMDHLADLEEVNPALSDADMSAVISTGDVEIDLLIHADTPEQAMSEGMSAVRAAIHAAGGLTPDWGSTGNDAWAMEYTGSKQRKADLVS